jgi:predicted nucleic acid-binding protein
MNSLDTNILIYASNEDAPEHAKAQKVVAKLLATPSEWILADQVLTPKTSKDLVFAPL